MEIVTGGAFAPLNGKRSPKPLHNSKQRKKEMKKRQALKHKTWVGDRLKQARTSQQALKISEKLAEQMREMRDFVLSLEVDRGTYHSYMN